MLSFLLRNAGGRRHPRKGFYRTLVALGPIIIPTSKEYTLVKDTSKRFFTVLFRDTIRDINDEFISYNVSFIICEDIKNMGFKGLVIKFFVKIFDIRRILLIILRSFMILPSFKS